MKCWRVGGGLVVWLAFSSPTFAQVREPGAATVSEVAGGTASARAVERALHIIDLVLDNHLASPTRQEMLLNGTRGLLAAAKLPVPAGLSRRVSDLATREQSAAFLTEIWSQAVRAGVASEEARQALDAGMLGNLPGGVNVLPAKELKVAQSLQANQYVGIGIALSGKDGAFTMNLFPNGPADKAGAKTGDQIEAIDGARTKGLKLPEVVDRLRGPEGSEVTLLLKRGDEQQTLKITRGVVPRETVFGRNRSDDRSPWNYQVDPALPIAYVRIGEVGGSTVHELRQIEQKLRADEIKALIIDLQNEGNGTDPHYAVMLADALLAGGKIGAIRQGEQVKEFTADPNCLFADWPLAVLVNEHTDGPVEWLAAALQDNRRAVIVGRSTSGNAWVTSQFDVPGTGEVLIVPTGTLERPSGKQLAKPLSMAASRHRPVIALGRKPVEQAWGVRPDHEAGVPQPVATNLAAPPGTFIRSAGSPSALKIVTIKNDPVLLAVEVLRKELGIVVQSQD